MSERQELELVALSALRIKVRPDIYPDASPREFDSVIECNTGIFNGVVNTVFFDDDLLAFKEQLEVLQVPGSVVLGGDRCAEVAFEVDHQEGGTPGSLAMEVSVTACGDDPWPRLLFVEYDVPADFPKTLAAKIDAFLSAR